jgi:hypothetical protein
MAYAPANLTNLAYGDGFSMWRYKSDSDSLSTIVAPAYFTGDSGNAINPGDKMAIQGSDAAADYIVTSGGENATIHVDRVDGTFRVKDSKKIYHGMLLTQTALLAGTSFFVGTHVKGYITRISTVIKKTVTTGGTLTIELAGTAVPGLSITIADGDAAGAVQTAVPDNPTLAANLIPALVAGGTGDIELVGDSNFATAGEVYMLIEISPFPDQHSTNNLQIGTFVNETDVLAPTSHFIVSPVAGQIESVNIVTNKAVGTGGDVTVEVGGTAVTGLTGVVANSAAVGDNDTDDAADLSGATGAIEANGAIELVFEAAFASSGNLWVGIEVNPTTDSDVKVYADSFIEQTDLLAGTSHFVIAPCSGHIHSMTSVVKKAVTTGGTLTMELGGEAVNGLAVVVADSSGVGAIDTDQPAILLSDSTRVSKGDAIEIVGDSTFASAGEVWVQIAITPA